MNYEQRIAIVRQWFKNDIAPRFSMPKDVDPKIAANDTIEAVNNSIAAHHQDITPVLNTTLKNISSIARSRTLPTIKDFREAASNASQSHGVALSAGISASLDSYQLTAKKVRAGEPIGDQWLRHELRKQLLENTTLTEDDLKPYDLYIAAHTQ